MEKENIRNKNFFEAWKNAISGIIFAIKTGKNLKIQICVAIIVIIFAICFKATKIEWLFLIFAIMLVLICETINTAIEQCVNLVTEEYSIIAKRAKDVAAGAVVLASLNAVIIGIIIFTEKIF